MLVRSFAAKLIKQEAAALVRPSPALDSAATWPAAYPRAPTQLSLPLSEAVASVQPQASLRRESDVASGTAVAADSEARIVDREPQDNVADAKDFLDNAAQGESEVMVALRSLAHPAQHKALTARHEHQSRGLKHPRVLPWHSATCL